MLFYGFMHNLHYWNTMLPWAPIKYLMTENQILYQCYKKYNRWFKYNTKESYNSAYTTAWHWRLRTQTINWTFLLNQNKGRRLFSLDLSILLISSYHKIMTIFWYKHRNYNFMKHLSLDRITNFGLKTFFCQTDPCSIVPGKGEISISVLLVSHVINKVLSCPCCKNCIFWLVHVQCYIKR